MILPPLGVFLILTSAYPSSNGIGAMFLIKFLSNDVICGGKQW